MAAVKLYFVFFLLFAFVSARHYGPYDIEQQIQATEAVTVAEDVKIGSQDQNNLVTTTPPAPDGSYIEIYQKNQYHNDGRPAKLVTIYKKCTANGTCRNIHYLEIALDD